MNNNIHEVNEGNFENEVLKSDVPVLVDFWASWCNPCRMLAPVIDQLADEYQGKVKVAKVNVDENPKLSAKYEISGIPAVFLFKSGQKVDEMVGVRPKPAFDQMLNKNL